MDRETTTRAGRKLDHLRHAVALRDDPAAGGLPDVHLVHQALPELNLDEVTTETAWLGKTLSQPLIINAMTGGMEEGGRINAALARVAARAGVALAVGSQRAALDDPRLEDSFRVAREENPDGVVLANVSAATPPEGALRAVEMLRADALQLHLNAAQELAMAEGDRDFRGLAQNIARVVACSPVPVVAKEVGNGLSREAAWMLFGAGVRWLDVGGRGGTDFVTIERQRNRETPAPPPAWGIGTVASLLEARSTGLPFRLVATGGVRGGLDVARCLALGADLAGAAGVFLRALEEGGEDGLLALLQRWREELRRVMCLAGAASPRRLRACPVVVTGETRRWLQARGIALPVR
ncbi:MAG: type 2 isopentenyl-diphosphate Delta-isomerase [Armatimonadota bacterium]|nr:type 2 isopentenyl-diphosphate Delta-isomerase [Armatimonadota bacterium]